MNPRGDLWRVACINCDSVRVVANNSDWHCRNCGTTSDKALDKREGAEISPAAVRS